MVTPHNRVASSPPGGWINSPLGNGLYGWVTDDAAPPEPAPEQIENSTALRELERYARSLMGEEVVLTVLGARRPAKVYKGRLVDVTEKLVAVDALRIRRNTSYHYRVTATFAELLGGNATLEAAAAERGGCP